MWNDKYAGIYRDSKLKHNIWLLKGVYPTAFSNSLILKKKQRKHIEKTPFEISVQSSCRVCSHHIPQPLSSSLSPPGLAVGILSEAIFPSLAPQEAAAYMVREGTSSPTSRCGTLVENPPDNAGDMSSILGSGRFPCRRKWQPTPVFLPGKSHGQRSLAGCSPRGHKRVGHDWHTHTLRCGYWVVLALQSQASVSWYIPYHMVLWSHSYIKGTIQCKNGKSLLSLKLRWIWKLYNIDWGAWRLRRESHSSSQMHTTDSENFLLAPWICSE